MAVPLTFKPIPVDPKLELQRRLAAAPVEHGEALLVLWDLLETAHDQGILDLLDGMVSAKDKIAETVAKYANTPEGIAGIRNVLTAAKILASVDPEVLERLSRVVSEASAEQRRETEPPSLWEIAKRAASEDSRRGLSFATLLLSGLGKSLK
jgi:uncharacterized protein YjgD (DUF1641 family)